MAVVLCAGLDWHEAGRALGQRSSTETMVPQAGRGDYLAAPDRDCLVRQITLERPRGRQGSVLSGSVEACNAEDGSACWA